MQPEMKEFVIRIFIAIFFACSHKQATFISELTQWSLRRSVLLHYVNILESNINQYCKTYLTLILTFSFGHYYSANQSMHVHELPAMVNNSQLDATTG
jgi:hypothetical protein